jgi:hypothetical protein
MDELETFEEIDISTWEAHADAQVGQREKWWIREPTGDIWLRKSPNIYEYKSGPGLPVQRLEHWPMLFCEHLALRLAAAASIPAVASRLAFWRDTTGPQVRRVALIVKKIEMSELQHGAAVVQGFRPEFIPENRPTSSLELVRLALEAYERRHGTRLLGDFLRMLIFDAWIGNEDRHTSNWAVLDNHRLAPLYDPASCLGARLRDDHKLVNGPKLSDLQKYANGCGSRFGNEASQLPQSEVVTRLRAWPEWDEIAPRLLKRFRSLLSSAEKLVSSVPDERLIPGRKQLIHWLLRERLRMLEECR